MRSFGNISSAVSRNAADVQLVHCTTFRDGSVLTESRVLEGNDYLVTVSPVRYYRQKDPDEVYENDSRLPDLISTKTLLESARKELARLRLEDEADEGDSLD